MAKGQKCKISNCINIISYKGTVCATHKWRMKKFNSYDLPGHIGDPSIYVKDPELPEGIVKICDAHGKLTDNEVYNRYYKGNISSRYCKKCILSNNIQRKYQGMNGLECYESLLIAQNHVCAICSGKEIMTRNDKIKRFSIDHDHETGKVRGLLCQFCNSLIGYAYDDIEILESAIKYLKSHQPK